MKLLAVVSPPYIYHVIIYDTDNIPALLNICQEIIWDQLRDHLYYDGIQVSKN